MEQTCDLPLLLLIRKHADDPRRVQLSGRVLFKQKLRGLPVDVFCKILRPDIFPNPVEQGLILNQPGKKKPLGLLHPVFFLMLLMDTGF